MSVIYDKGNIKLQIPKTKLHVDVVYARPEDEIHLDFVVKNTRVTFVNGDLNFIFSNGSMITLASYGALAFGDDAPKMYDKNGALISVEDLLQEVQVSDPADSVLILANRDKFHLVHNEKEVDRILLATFQSGTLQNGNPIAGNGLLDDPSTGVPSDVVDKSGMSYAHNYKRGIDEYVRTIYTTKAGGPTPYDSIRPGNTEQEYTPTLKYTFAFDIAGGRFGNTRINDADASYFCIQYGSDVDFKNAKLEDQTTMIRFTTDFTNGALPNRVFDAHSVGNHIVSYLLLDYRGGIFPSAIIIKGIPTVTDEQHNRMFNLELDSSSNASMDYRDGNYSLSPLDPSGKIILKFTVDSHVPDQEINIDYAMIYFDYDTGKQSSMDALQTVNIKSLHNANEDSGGGGGLINKSCAGIGVDVDAAGNGIKYSLAEV